MEKKGELCTVRLTKEEGAQVRRYLKDHPVFQGFSGFARTAITEFMRTQTILRLRPLPAAAGSGRPSFLWDYDLTEAEARAWLKTGPKPEHYWLVARILERARWEEIWSYLTLEQIASVLEDLRMPEKVKAHWRYAVARWTRPASQGA